MAVPPPHPSAALGVLAIRNPSGWLVYTGHSRRMQIQTLILEGIPAGLQLAIIAIFLKRKPYRRFPWFFVYTVFSIVATIGRHSVNHNPELYYWVYWTTEIVFGVFALLALNEVFAVAAEVFYFGRGLFRFLPTVAVVAVVSYAGFQALYRAPSHANDPASNAMARLQAGGYALTFGIRCLETLIFVLCLRLSRKDGSGVQWGRYDHGILYGFGLIGALTSLIYLARLSFGQNLEGLFRFAPSGVYLGATLTWFDAFRRKEPPFTKKPPTMEDLDRLDAWIDSGR